MSLFFQKRAEERSVSYQDVWSRGDSVSRFGDPVDAALRLIPVYAATSLIADQLAACPLAVFEKTDGVPKRVSGVQLVEDPGPYRQDIYSWKFQALTSALLRGNAYGLILDVDRAGIPSKVEWLKPEDMTIDGHDFYWKGRKLDRNELIHVPAYVVPGSIQGLSPIGLFKLQVETGIEAQQFGKKFFKRGTIPGGDLEYTKSSLTAEQAQEGQERFVASVSSAKPFVHGTDWKYTPITIPGGEAQFLAAINATANQIAAAYRVEPEDVGGVTGGSTLKYATLEMNQLKFSVRTLRPWASRFEAALNRYLPDGQYVKFNLDSAARADLKTRVDAEKTQIFSGTLTLDEARALEERPPLTAEQFDAFLSLNRPSGIDQ